MHTLEKDYLSVLNEQQRFAVTHSEGPMLILAGAGSGKTRTITYKIAHLIRKGRCAPGEILAVTFTNKAAEEMRSRVERLLDDRPLRPPLVCTFHSFGVRLLRRHAERVGYKSGFIICDRDDQVRTIKSVYKDLGLSERDLSVRQTLAAISWAKSRNWSPDQVGDQPPGPLQEEMVRVYSGYQQFLKRSNGMDFDDLILLTVRLLEENPDLAERYSNDFPYVLIDEYQDTNRPQYDLIRKLTRTHQNLTAVGDEDQSIYAFRGADINNILRFESDYPGATIVKMEQNYRSTQNILDAATSVVSNNVNRKGKVLWTSQPAGDPIEVYAASDARGEAVYVAQMIYQLIHEGEKGFAILYRTNFQSRQFEEALRQLDIPYKLIGGVSFYQRKEVKDALAYLRLISNPKDGIALLRVINQPPRGIGQVTLDRLQEEAAAAETTLWEALCKGLETNAYPGRTHRPLQEFRDLVESCREFLTLPLHLFLEKTLECSGYIDWLRGEDSEESHNRILNLEELVTLAREQVELNSSLEEFLDQAALRSEADEYDDSAVVTMMTLHNAKGLEFPVVFLAGCEEGLFPHSRAVAENDLEEERRLCYVGLTRAEKRIFLSYSRRRRFFGKDTEEVNSPSRFLEEIPENLLRLHTPSFGGDERRWQAPSAGRSVRERRGPKPGFKTYDTPESIRGFLQELPARSSKTRGFVAGARIVHDKFGYGKVLSVQETGDDLKITVNFPGVGIKKLLQSYARLKLA